jgi:predicted kinase
MMNNSEGRPTLVLMAGLSGAGKTTLAVQLGALLRWSVLSKDTLKPILMTKTTEEVAGFLAYEAAFALAHDMLVRQQLSIIIDSSAHHLFILNRAREIAQAANARLVVILCLANGIIRTQRLIARNEPITPSKFPLLTTEEERREFSHLPTDILSLYTLSPIEECVASALTYLSGR